MITWLTLYGTKINILCIYFNGSWKYRASTQTSTQINGQSHAGHKDLAAIPLNKAILDIGRPNLTIYKPHFTFPHGTRGTAQKPGAHCHSNLHPPTISITLEVWAESWSPGTISQILAPRTSLYHFHHPKTTCPDSNTYKKLLIYKQREFMGGSPQSKPFIEELITESPKSPVSQPPDSNQMAKIETDYWSASHDSSLWRQNGGSRRHLRDFPSGAVVKNPPANAGDAGSIPGPGRSHMLWSN